MKKSLTLILICALMIASCSKTTSPTPTNLCVDRVMDGGETEIDCGGSCSACPPVAAISSSFLSNPYVASSIYANYTPSTDAVSLNTSGTAGQTVQFTFVGSNIGVSNVTAATCYLSSDSYVLSSTQPGTVTITSKDTLRSIISGSFNINLVRQSGGSTNALTGSFTNLRYNPTP